MEMVVPDLKSSGFEYLVACGRIRTPDTEICKWVKRHSERYYYYQFKVQSGLVYCRVDMDLIKDYLHLHIEAGTREAFKKTPTLRKSEIAIDHLLRPFLNWKITALVTGQFNVPVDRLPPIIHVTRNLAVEKAGVAMKMTGGTLSVDGAPISSIEWSMPDDGDADAHVFMQGRTALKMSTAYLEDCRQFVSSYSDTFLERKTNNGKNGSE
jgi:hypothetical protein